MTRGYLQGFAICISIVFAVLYLLGVADTNVVLVGIAFITLFAFAVAVLMILTTSVYTIVAYALLAVAFSLGIATGIRLLDASILAVLVFVATLRLANFASETWRYD